MTFTDVLCDKTAKSQVYDEHCVFTIVVLDISCIDVYKQEEFVVKNTEMFEHEKFTMKLMDKVNKEVNNDKEEAVKKYEMNFKSGLKVRLKGVGTVGLNVELSRELMFPDFLDRAWDEFDDHKVDMLDVLPMVQVKLVSVLHAINTDLDQDQFDKEEDQFSHSALANTSDTMSST